MKTIGVEYEEFPSGGARTPPAASMRSSAQPTLPSVRSWFWNAYCAFWDALNVREASERDGRSDSRRVMLDAESRVWRGTLAVAGVS